MSHTPIPGRLLVASPTLLDPTFDETVILMLEHDASGALGLVLNRPSELAVADATRPWAMHTSEPRLVFDGGPVQREAAFCLALVATYETPPVGFQPVVGRLGLADLEIDPFDLAVDVVGSRVFRGYAGWSPGQLERELREEAWFVVDASPADALTGDPETLWSAVLARQRGPLAWVAQFPDDPNDN